MKSGGKTHGWRWEELYGESARVQMNGGDAVRRVRIDGIRNKELILTIYKYIRLKVIAIMITFYASILHGTFYNSLVSS